jgi:hypothetical protein
VLLLAPAATRLVLRLRPAPGSDCSGCCRANSSNRRYKLLDLEASVAARLLGLDYDDPNFDVNKLNTPVNHRYKANKDTMPLCFRLASP